MKKYLLTLTEDQTLALSFASELVSRIYMGQLDSLRVFSKNHHHYEEINRLLDELRALMGLIPTIDGQVNPNAYWGIMSPEIHNRARALFDTYQVIRHEIWKETPNALKYTVDASPAFQTDFTQDLPEIKKI